MYNRVDLWNRRARRISLDFEYWWMNQGSDLEARVVFGNADPSTYENFFTWRSFFKELWEFYNV